MSATLDQPQATLAGSSGQNRMLPMNATAPHHPRSTVERLTPLDVSNLRVEDHGFPMHVAALALLDGRPLVDSAGHLRLDAIREHVEQRTHEAHRLRQVLAWPKLGPPFWVDDQDFAIARHVRTRALPTPGDEAALLEVCCGLNEPPLDRSRPLWELWLLTGLTGDRVGLLIRLHHVVADGMAAIALFASLFDPAADTPASAVPPQGHGSRPTAGPATRVVMWARQLAAIAREGWAPMVSLNCPVGPHRRIMLVGADLAATKAVAHRHGATVNDVVLAAVAGGARRLLDSRGELKPDLALKVSEAVSIRGSEEAGSGGNRVGIRVVPVPVAEPDPVRRLEEIAAATVSRRRIPPYLSGRLLQRWMVRVMFHQRMVNLLVSNLPGPPEPIYFAGARVRDLFQIGVLQGNLALGVGILSYAGRLNFDILVDADAFPDVAVFTQGLTETLEQLGAVSPQEPVT